ncbi:uncharacterized protein SETTUDRAFT_44078 [Exserohilum turcica Et28A]|uniref:Amidohydrolase-related domain-containing protein n=1 Tax=Exserohilum turcicum (strain 28A) TaxID=671987 RepID=R0I9R1_EXST2|nr:uncharacterized protein SETTUDRAFT_44078 [Exserohilum turcica Et28A]EOA82195.1 hypothetical protein SETTUDRAFT_44078 [Exserohilum turcica Et28A]
MASRFVENLQEVPISHPHLNVSLDDILAEERRKRSSSQSSASSETRRSGSTSAAMSPTSPTSTESKIKRAFTIAGKKSQSHLTPSLPFTSPSSSPTQPSLHQIPPPTLTKLRNLSAARIKDMRVLGHTRQIISHVPVAVPAPTCAKHNDAMQAAVVMNAEKFAVLAALPADGREAARELLRCVTRYGFVGGVIALARSPVCGWEGEEWDEVWSQAEKLRVPIMVRKMWPLVSEIPEYQHGLASSLVAPLVTHLHTAHAASPLPLVQLYLSGVFDRHPNLRLIFAHPGSLPSLVPRIQHLLTSIPASERPRRGFLEVWQHNIYLTTADAQDLSSLRALLEQIPVDRVLYATNYPFEERGKELIEELKASGFLTKTEYERVAWVNAETLFNLKGVGKSGR